MNEWIGRRGQKKLKSHHTTERFPNILLERFLSRCESLRRVVLRGLFSATRGGGGKGGSGGDYLVRVPHSLVTPSSPLSSCSTWLAPRGLAGPPPRPPLSLCPLTRVSASLPLFVPHFLRPFVPPSLPSFVPPSIPPLHAATSPLLGLSCSSPYRTHSAASASLRCGSQPPFFFFFSFFHIYIYICIEMYCFVSS